MAQYIQSRAEFKEYCLRALGKGAVTVNITDEQAEDRIDEALRYFYDNAAEGTELVYTKHQITADDVTNKYITVPDSILSISRLIPASSYLSGDIFSAEYQFRLNELMNMSDMSISYYAQRRQYMNLIQDIFNKAPREQFVRYHNRLKVEADWGLQNGFKVGQWIVYEGHKIIDPIDSGLGSSMYDDPALRELAVAFMKRQWGANLGKYDQVQLPGGATVRGGEIYSEAREEIKEIKEDIDLRYSAPPRFFVGPGPV